jgi:osmotically inducible lipoprotein OsmB
MMKKTVAIALTPVILLTACSGMSDSQQRELSGAAIGAAAGAGIVAIAGGTAIWGAVGGAAVGAVGGYAYDKYEKSKQQEYNAGYQAGKASQ